MNPKLLIVALILGLGGGLYIGKTFYSTTKTVEVEKQVTRTDVVTVVKQIERPDGSKETLTTTTDKSVAKRSDTSQTVLAPSRPLYALTASYSVNPVEGNLMPIYSVQLTKQFLGPFSLGLRVQSDKQVGLVVGWAF